MAGMAELPIGRRDARLLELRRRLFGESISALARCPSCGVTVEVGFQVSDMVIPPAGDDGPHEVRREGWGLEFRLPNSRDMMAAASAAGTDEARAILLDRCVLSVTDESGDRRIGEAPAELVQLMEERMAAADPQADARIAVDCAACDATWEASLEADSFVTAEVFAGANRLLEEIHVLARSYGWTEAEILGLGPRRREAYLALVAAG